MDIPISKAEQATALKDIAREIKGVHHIEETIYGVSTKTKSEEVADTYIAMAKAAGFYNSMKVYGPNTETWYVTVRFNL